MAAGKLRAAFGGEAIGIPKNPEGTSWESILATIGQESALELVRIYSGESLYIAKDAKAMQQWHKARIAELRAQGKTWRQIARQHTFESRFSERWVRKLGGEAQASTPKRPQAAAAQCIGQQSIFDIPELHPLNALFGRPPHSVSSPSGTDSD